jgi:hypothetical protein
LKVQNFYIQLPLNVEQAITNLVLELLLWEKMSSAQVKSSQTAKFYRIWSHLNSDGSVITIQKKHQLIWLKLLKVFKKSKKK